MHSKLRPFHGQLPDGVGTNGVVTEMQPFPIVNFHGKRDNMWQHVRTQSKVWQHVGDLWPCEKTSVLTPPGSR